MPPDFWAALLLRQTRIPFRRESVNFSGRKQAQFARFQPAGKALYGYIHNPFGKTKFAKRNVFMTARIRAVLEMRHSQQERPSKGWVFPAETKSDHVDSVKSQHARALKDSGIIIGTKEVATS